MDDWAATVRDELTRQLIHLSVRQADRAMTFSAYGLMGLIGTIVSIWKAASGDGWYLLGAVATGALFLSCLTLLINAKVEERYLVRQIGEVERNWPSRR